MIKGDIATPEELAEFTIELQVKDIQKSIDFYTKILGFQLYRIGTDGKFAIIYFSRSILMLMEIEGLAEPRFSGLEVRIMVDDVDSFYEEVKKRGGKIEEELKDKDYGLRTFFVKNPDNVKLKFASPIK